MKKWMFIVLMAFVCLAGTLPIALAEELSVIVTPVYSPYWERTMPWNTEENVLMQFSFSGLQVNANKTKSFELKFSLFFEGEQIYSNDVTSTYPFSRNSKGPTICFPFGQLKTGNYCLKTTVNDLISGKTVTKETPFEIEDKKDFRLLGLLFIDNMTRCNTPPICFARHKVGILFACSSAVQIGDKVTVTVTDKESSLLLGSYDPSDSRSLNVICFYLDEPGKHILLLKAVDKTKNLEVEYELPVIVVDPSEIME